MRVMVDTTVLIGGSGWPRWPYEVLLAGLRGQYQLVVSPYVSEDKDLTAEDGTTVLLHQRLAVRLSGAFLREVLGWRSEALEAIRGRTWADLQAPAGAGPTESA